jgi:cation transport regulator ChaC
LTDYVFGYASLVALEDADALSGRLRGFRRCWGVAMNNWEGGEGAKHFLDRESGERPRIRVAYLDIERSDGSGVNGVAIPVEVERLAALDEREINYQRVEVTEAFEGPASGRIFTYVGLDAARERCRQGTTDGNVFASQDYAAGVRLAFERLGGEALAEFDRTTEPLPFQERDLQVVLPSSTTGS